MALLIPKTFPEYSFFNNYTSVFGGVKDKDTIPMMLVGNKCDLEQKREVSTQEGKDLVEVFRQGRAELDSFEKAAQRSAAALGAMDTALDQMGSSGIPLARELGDAIGDIAKNGTLGKAALIALGAAAGKLAYDYFGASTQAAIEVSNEVKENQIEGVRYLPMNVEQINYMSGEEVDICFHLAALSRIQPSFENPSEFFRVNTSGTEAVCEWARKWNVKVVYAGSSSQWHDPFQSPYAMYKKLGEDVCKMYKKVFGTNIEIARFYNVYGPHEITEGMWAAVIGKWRGQVEQNYPITIVGDGEQRRDFTHIDDIVAGLLAALDQPVVDDGQEKAGGSFAPHRLYNIGNHRSEPLMRLIALLEEACGRQAEIDFQPLQPGDVLETYADIDDIRRDLGFQPKTPIDVGIPDFVTWLRAYQGL